MHDPPAFGERAAAARSHYVYEPIDFGAIGLMRRRDVTQAPGLE
jgi:hypothetical protein